MNHYPVETSGSETDADSVSSNMSVDCWWTSMSLQDPWHHPLVGVEPNPVGKIDLDATETCMTDDDEDGLSSGEEFWMNGLEQDDGMDEPVVPADLFSPELEPLTRQPFDPWDYIATEEFLVNDLAMDETTKDEEDRRVPESRRDDHSELHLADGTSTTKQLEEIRTRLAASMRASQKSRRECWHSNRKLQHLMPNQRHRNQVQKVLEEITRSTATVQHHCLWQHERGRSHS
jgi:hypothetical protein